MPYRRIRTERRLYSWWQQMAYSSRLAILTFLYQKNLDNGRKLSEAISRYSSPESTGTTDLVSLYPPELSPDSRQGESTQGISDDTWVRLMASSWMFLVAPHQFLSSGYGQNTGESGGKGNGQKLRLLSASA